MPLSVPFGSANSPRVEKVPVSFPVVVVYTHQFSHGVNEPLALRDASQLLPVSSGFCATRKSASFHYSSVIVSVVKSLRVMTRGIYYLLLMLPSFASLDVDAFPGDYAEDYDGAAADDEAWSIGGLMQDNELGTRREEAREKLQEIFGIRGHSDKSVHHKVPPQFMVELYNTIADSDGVTRGRNPYNAKVVRSFIERDTSLSHFYVFNISGLEVNESVLEAELHLYRKKTPLKTTHQTALTSPYYLIRVYQVLEDKSLDVPDLHRLLNVRYVGAHSSGWQVFNVKQAVLSWVSGEQNLGLLVTASTVFEDEVTVEFSRRNEYHRSKQPILVLFDDNGSKEQRTKIIPRYYSYSNNENADATSGDVVTYDTQDEKIDIEADYEQDEQYRRTKREKNVGQPEVVPEESVKEPEYFQRQKRKRPLASSGPSQLKGRRNSGRKQRRIVSGKTRLPDILTSMDIYERAMLREKMGKLGRDRTTSRKSIRERRAAKKSRSHASVNQRNTTECSRHELYVDFKEIGLSSSIIAPVGYSAYHCKGLCESPLSQDQQPTNHATVQGIVHKMGLVKGVEMPCCVPTKLLSTTILFFDDNENVVLKVYEDMIADRCGCR